MVVGEINQSSISVSIPKTPGLIKNQSYSGDFAKAFFVLIAVSLLRLIIIKNLPLTGDEAYYWQWSRHLALGYHDHPPLVGWLIKISSFLGSSAFWVRLPSIFLSFFSSLFLYLFIKELWQNEKNAFRGLCLFLSIPIFSICALAIFPDAPLVFSWSFFLWASWKWFLNEKNWPWMGLALGLAALSKLMGLFLLPSFLLFLFLTDKSHFKKSSLWKAIALAFFIAAPFLYWNLQHHFETFTYQAHQRLTRGLSFSPSTFLNYVSLQFVALSPLVFILTLITLKMLFSKAREGNIQSRYLLCMAVPIHLFFIAVSFSTRVGLHWALPGYLSILAAVPFWLDECKKRGIGWAKHFYQITLSSSLAFTLFFFSLLIWPQHLVPWISSLGIHSRSVNQGKTLNSQSMAEILGYQELGTRVEANLKLLQGSNSQGIFVFTDSYSLSSIISFYGNVDVKTLLFTSTGGDYNRWNHFEKSKGLDALYVDTQPIGSRADINEILQQAFQKVVPLSPLTVQRGAIQAGTFYFARCIRLENPEALRPTWTW